MIKKSLFLESMLPVEELLIRVARGDKDNLVPASVEFDVVEAIPVKYAKQVAKNLNHMKFDFKGYGFSAKSEISSIKCEDISKELELEEATRFSIVIEGGGYSFLNGLVWMPVDASRKAIVDEYERIKKLESDIEFIADIKYKPYAGG